MSFLFAKLEATLGSNWGLKQILYKSIGLSGPFKDM